MIAQSPFVVVITGPSAGVGKSTLATNLAVYLKALDEGLPVAYASLEADAAVDAMFQLGERPKYSWFDFSQQRSFAETFILGQFGVEYCAASPSHQQCGSLSSMRKRLMQTDYPGILILDIAGDNPCLTAALTVADLLLVPVKDPAVLPNIINLQKELLAVGGSAEQLWLLPSQLGEESRYQQQVALDDFLRFAADERGFQVLDELLSCDQQVAVQAVELAKPVLTRVPQSSLHQQFKQVAELVINQRQQQASFSVRVRRMLLDRLLPAKVKRISLYCPLCELPVSSGQVHYLESSPARRRMLLHQECVSALLRGTGTAEFSRACGLTLVQPGVLFGGRASQLRVQVLSGDLDLLNTEIFSPAIESAWLKLVQTATGRCLSEIYCELFIFSAAVSLAEFFTADWTRQFVTQRSSLHQACREEKL